MSEYRNSIDHYAAELKKSSLTAIQLFSVVENTPLCVALWNAKWQNVYCNRYTARLFGSEERDYYFQNIAQLSPEKQPDGRLSSQAAEVYMKQVNEKGTVRFYWMHCKADGEEIPTEITLYKLDVQDGDGSGLLVTFIHDLRAQLAGYDEKELIGGFFFNSITNKALFEAVAELSDEWFWAYDIQARTIQFFGKGRAILGLPAEKQPFPQTVVESGVVYPEDLPHFLEMSEAMKKCFEKPFDVRFILTDGSVKYFRVVWKATLDANGTPLFTIGKTYDIHEQKSLEVLSRTDLLTNCLNKVATENAVKEAIKNEKNGTHALFVIDVDNFKAVNDNLGHHFGDIVLREIAANLHTNFRDGDIIGRIGGDEFIVFVQNVTHEPVLAKKANIISQAFQNTYSGENADYKISGSIGIALYPKNGTDYESLYKAADKALYQSKMQGKDCYTFYSDKLVDGTMKNLTIVENASRLANSYFDSELVSTVFDILYESKDTSMVLSTVLQLIGKHLHVDRSYLFETFDGGNHYSVTYEWCEAGVSKEIENLQNISKDTLGDFFDSLDENGILYSNDIHAIESEDAYRLVRGQSIQAFLLVQSKAKKYTRLVLGLDDCKHARVWSEKEINSMQYALKMVSIFIGSEERKTTLQNQDLLGICLSEEERAVLQKLKEKGIGFTKL